MMGQDDGVFGTVIVGKVIAETNGFLLRLDRVMVSPTELTLRLNHRCDEDFAPDPFMDDFTLTLAGGVRMGFKYPDGRSVHLAGGEGFPGRSGAQGDASDPEFLELRAEGNFLAGSADYSVRPLPEAGGTFFVEWRHLPSGRVEWRVSAEIIEAGMAAFTRLSGLSDGAFSEFIGDLGAVAAQLADRGAVVVGPEAGYDPHVSVPVASGAIDVHRVTESDVRKITDLLHDAYLVEVSGNLDATIIILGDGDEASATVRALAAWMGTR
ncbi:hypothetical protein [Actinomadura sp. 6N118]|uniref:hypothetical protein n=1 Tax=Actinomadura sp. 6N118 TaxID=3375151 RepID=UPI0037B8D214